MWFFRTRIDSVQAFYANSLLRSLYMAMTTIYVPIFLYLKGSELWGSATYGLLLIVAFYGLQRIFLLIGLFPLSKMVEKMGFRKSISLSVIFLMGYTGSLLLSQSNLYFLIAAIVCGSCQITLYWLSRDSALSQDIKTGLMGSRMGFIGALENIAGLLGPFVGGVIVTIFGYSTLFVVALIILGLSAIPLWWMPPHSHKNGVTWSGFWYFISDARYLHQAVASFSSALNEYGNGVIWPIILFVQGIQNENLGVIYSAVAVVTIVVQYLAGTWFDKLRARKDFTDEGIYGIATVGLSMAWVVRIFVNGISQILPIDMGRQIFAALHSNFYNDYNHLGGKRMGSIAYWVYSQAIYSVGAIFLFGVMGIGIYFGVWKELVLVTIALWSLGSMVAARESNLR